MHICTVRCFCLVPRDFAEKRTRRETMQVQLLVDAVNANTATIAGGYAARIIANLNQRIASSRPPRLPPGGDPANAPNIAMTTNNPVAAAADWQESDQPNSAHDIAL